MAKAGKKLQPIYYLIDKYLDNLVDINIFRTKENDIQTTGILITLNDNGNWWPPVAFHTLELPWRNNERNVSRIPPGIYEAQKYKSLRFNRTVILLKGVPGRDAIEIHPGNTVKGTTGCILVGMGIGDINQDGVDDVTRSREAMDKLIALLPDTFRVRVWDCFEKGD